MVVEKRGKRGQKKPPIWKFGRAALSELHQQPGSVTAGSLVALLPPPSQGTMGVEFISSSAVVK